MTLEPTKVLIGASVSGPPLRKPYYAERHPL